MQITGGFSGYEGNRPAQGMNNPLPSTHARPNAAHSVRPQIDRALAPAQEMVSSQAYQPKYARSSVILNSRLQPSQDYIARQNQCKGGSEGRPSYAKLLDRLSDIGRFGPPEGSSISLMA